MYIKGVGTGDIAPIWGAITGAGINTDVLNAYEFLANTYRPNMKDEIYVFGFSRGAYAARIFSGFLEVAGLPDLPVNSSRNLVKRMFKAFRSETKIDKRKLALLKVKDYQSIPEKVEIKFLGLWDTVAALGWPNGKEDTDELDKEYIDQLCNIKRAAHALSIDDNRATLFTPVLLTSNRLTESCPSKNIDDVVNEVWFSGSHSDVGGGYDNSELSGVSLNWMIYQIKDTGLLPENTRVFADFDGKDNTTDTGFLGYIIYRNFSRTIPFYYGNERNNYNKGKPKIHRSVFDRLAKKPKIPRRFDWTWPYGEDKDGNVLPNFIDCLNRIDTDQSKGKDHWYTLKEKDGQECFSIVEYYDW